jgi:magnesium transporter
MLRLFGPDCSPAPVEAADLKALPDGAQWIDLLEPSKGEEQLAERAIGTNIPTREELLEIEPSSRLYTRNGNLFMTASVLYGVTDQKPNNDPVGFILTPDRLVTLRYIDPKPFIVFAEHLHAEPELASDPLSILVRLLDSLVDRLADEMEEAGREIERVSGHVFERRARGGSERRRSELRLEALLMRIGRVQQLLAEIRESTLSTSRMLNFFAASKRLRDSEHYGHVESLKYDISALLDHSTFLADNLTFLLDASLGMISLEQNFVMKLFAVLAVVFMPPTLIAGIYGMNFEHMPELDWVFGYPLALGLIVLSAVVPYLMARRSGWL